MRRRFKWRRSGTAGEGAKEQRGSEALGPWERWKPCWRLAHSPEDTELLRSWAGA
ncbi:hypothetical protein PF003_g28729 [Phytophthora fragariae]|nr:hypothetical protein PF003_g28729 [Phytophthora fragariae]